MGNFCTKPSNVSATGAAKSQPMRAPNLSGQNETLTFNVLIANIKGKNLPITTNSVRIIFANRSPLNLSEMTVNSNSYRWKFSQEFDYTTQRRSLQTDLLSISVIDKFDKEIGKTEINLYDIATGPTHIDLALKMRKGIKETGRVSLDIKMSQMVHINAKALKVICRLKDSLKEKFYNFSLKMYARDQEFSSDHSPNFKNVVTVSILNEKTHEEFKDENYQLTMEENKSLKLDSYLSNGVIKAFPKPPHENLNSIEETSETCREGDIEIHTRARAPTIQAPAKASGGRQSTLSPIWAGNKEIVWDFTENMSNAVCLEINVNVRDLANGSLQFFLWANKEMLSHLMSNDGDHDSSGQEVYIDHKLVGECYIGMNKFFFDDAEINFGEGQPGNSTQPSSESSNERRTQTRVSQFNQKMWFHGVHIGELIAEFVVENTSFYKQMICGVRTEEGVQKTSMLVMNKEKPSLFSKNTNVKEVKILDQHKDTLNTIIFNLSNTNNDPRLKIKLTDDLATTVQKVLEILRSSHKESMLSFLYKTPESLLASQRILIGLAKHFLDYADEAPSVVRNSYYDSLLLLMNRGEFELNFMGFEDSYSEFLGNAQKASYKNDATHMKLDMKNFQLKLEVCEKYQALLYETLKKVLEKMNQKALPECERKFVEQFLAIAYFRIPEFRKKILENIYDEIKDIKIDEWRGTEWNIDENLDDEKKNRQFLALFDWQKDFYVYLQNTRDGEKNYKLLEEILSDTTWQNRFRKRGIAFYFFLEEWAKHVNKTVVIKEHLPWQDLPGYTILLKAFLVALKTKDVKSYPEALINTSNTILKKNEKLLNICVTIMYNKTRIYDSSSVFTVYEIINKWLTNLRQEGKQMPSIFDYSFFFKGVNMILEGEHALNISKVLWMIYNNFNIFPYDQKQLLSEMMLGRLFFKLFLHWSWNVRQVFHSLLIYRFYHQHRTTNTNLKNLDDLTKELLLYNQKRKNVNRTKKILINDFINMEYSRNMTIIENGYKKIREQKSLTKIDRKLHTKRSLRPRQATMEPIALGSRVILDTSNNSMNNIKRPQKNEFSRLQLKISQSEGIQLGSKKGSDIEIGSKSRELKPQDDSFMMINPDKLEITIDDRPSKPARSESMRVISTFMRNSDKQNHFAEIDAMIEKKNQEEQKFEEIQGNLDDSPLLNNSDKKKIIHRRIIYFDKQSNQIQEIPEQYLVYLETAYNEYERTKEHYLGWLIQVDEKLKNAKEEDIKKFRADPVVPEINVAIPIDEVLPEPEQE